MALYNFQSRFVPKILAGEKTHTIRAIRNRRTNPGETLHLYTGLRQKGARLLMRATCTKIETIHIDHDGATRIEGVYLSRDEMEHLAVRDGFDSAYEMLRFWEDRLPFDGEIIHWRER